ncbi:acyl-CoA thioesterase [Halocola ammonii]
MIEFDWKLRVRYGETDRMGYVYYGNYAEYFEVARVEMLRAAGVSYRDLEDKGILLPVLEYSVKYFQPVYYDEEITITISMQELPGVRIVFDYETKNESGTVVNKAQTTLVFVDRKSGKPVKCPADVYEAFENWR